MVTIHDVAAYVLRSVGPMSALRLHRLLYLAFAWSSVWDDGPLFAEPFHAWTNGPMAPLCTSGITAGEH